MRIEAVHADKRVWPFDVNGEERLMMSKCPNLK